MKHFFRFFIFIFFQVMQLSAADFIVINTNDSGPGSLREAITNANLSPGTDNIFFNIPVSDQGYNSMTGVWTIFCFSQ